MKSVEDRAARVAPPVEINWEPPKMSKRKKLTFTTLLILVVAAGAGIAWQVRGREAEGIEVETEPAAERTIVQTVTATGRIQPVTQVNISADVSAKITRLEVKEGDWVERGQLLLELDRERYVASVESAEASLRGAESNAEVIEENLIKTTRDYERTRELHAQSLESQAALDADHAAVQVERARHRSTLDSIAQARAALKQARDDQSKTVIYAPIAGTVSKLNKEKGEIALGSQFQEDVILVISNLAGMEAVVDVDENDIVSVAVGQPATLEIDALPGVSLAGRVTDIANSAKVAGSGTADQKTEFEVKVEVTEAHSALRPGMTASAEIVVATHEKALGVPIQSVSVRTLEQLGMAGGEAEGEPGEAGEVGDSEVASRFTPDAEGFVELVWVIEGGVARARQVATGIQSDSHIEIVSGLAAGEPVVTGSYRAISKDLEDGAEVLVQAPGGGKKKGADGSDRRAR